MILTSKKVNDAVCNVLSINSILYQTIGITQCVPYIYYEFRKVVKIWEMESVRRIYGVSFNVKKFVWSKC